MKIDGISQILASLHGDINQLSNVSQNLANVSTNAYKKGFAVTSVAMSEDRAQAVNQDLTTTIRESDFSQGVLKSTGRNLHLAIEGSGFFLVNDGTDYWLTRKGELSIDNQGYLTLLSGARLQGLQGDIALEPGEFDVDETGNIYQGEKEFVEQLSMFNAPLNSLVEGKPGMYKSSLMASTDQIHVRQGFLETSNVDQLQEMVKLMELVRHYEGGYQVIQSYSTIMDEAISKIGKV
ncbi:flagellar hook-basal body complex protein [Microbulbifer sp. SSSA005]|uniref:flagellar hook-basal body complex protein n=1 Tax=Microbulbifer sp. SSSA005 TaxID=3243378 RepID=UPI004039D4C9